MTDIKDEEKRKSRQNARPHSIQARSERSSTRGPIYVSASKDSGLKYHLSNMAFFMLDTGYRAGTSLVRNTAQGFVGWYYALGTDRLLRRRKNVPPHQIRERNVKGRAGQMWLAAAVLAGSGVVANNVVKPIVLPEDRQGVELLDEIYKNKAQGTPHHDAVLRTRIGWFTEALGPNGADVLSPAAIKKLKKVGQWPNKPENRSDKKSLERGLAALVKASDAIDVLGSYVHDKALIIHASNDKQSQAITNLIEAASVLREEGFTGKFDLTQLPIEDMYNALRAAPDGIYAARKCFAKSCETDRSPIYGAHKENAGFSTLKIVNEDGRSVTVRIPGLGR